MTRLTALIAAVLLAACAGGEAPETRPAAQSAAEVTPIFTEGVRLPISAGPVTTLPAQVLEPGSCGLFFWGVADPYPFIAFENEATRRAAIIHDQRAFVAPVAEQPVTFIQGDPFRRLYPLRGENIIATIEGEIGEDTAAGPAIERAVLRVRELDGTETVRPVVGLRGCRRSSGELGPDGISGAGRTRVVPGG